MTEATNKQIWKSALVPLDATIQQAINSLEASSQQIVLAVTDDGELCGTLTDGDIRRAFLRGVGLSSPIDQAINVNPLVVPPGLSSEVVIDLMQANKIHQMPVVDEQGKVMGLHIWDAIYEPIPLDNVMLIMAGGRGTRLGPHTEACPKPMLEVGGKPLLLQIIERAKADGFRDFIISLYYLGEMIESFFGDGQAFGVNIEYVWEREPLGTAGCLSLLSEVPSAPFIVTNGDVMTDIRYHEFLDFHKRHKASATMAVRQHEMQNQYGVVRTKGLEIEGFEEKPVYRSHVNAGIYVLEPCVLQYLEYEQHCDMPSLFERLKGNAERTVVYPMHEPWLDVGRPEDLENARSLHR